MKYVSGLCAVVFLASCRPAVRAGSSGQTERWNPPAPGAVAAADSISVRESAPNHFYFTVKLISSAQNIAGSAADFIYDAKIAYGPDSASGTVTMPRDGDHLQPLLRMKTTGHNEYSCIIGFRPGKDYGGDSTFHDYYQVTLRLSPVTMDIKALKSYTFQ